MAMRALTSDDTAICAEIHRACFGDAAWSRDQLAGSLDLDSTRGWLAFDAQERAQGFTLCQHCGDDIEILTIAILPQNQRAGIATNLLSCIFTAARIGGKVFLEVAADNTAAIALYCAAGFQQIGQRPGYYARKTGAVDALLFSMEIV